MIAPVKFIPLAILALSIVVWRAPAVAGPRPVSNRQALERITKNENVCATQIALVARTRHLPARLMAAISLVESGRASRDRTAIVAWPWTVTSGGKGRYYPTKAKAVAAVKRLRAHGVSNIDVGCMQVNLHFHPKAFSSIEQALDPAHNVGYAGTFLYKLKTASGSWADAVGRYHSGTAKRARAYRNKVFRRWRDGGRALARANAAASTKKFAASTKKFAAGMKIASARPARSKPASAARRAGARVIAARSRVAAPALSTQRRARMVARRVRFAEILTQRLKASRRARRQAGERS